MYLRYIVSLTVLLLLVYLLIFRGRDDLDHEAPAYNRGRGGESENIDRLLNRIDWVSNYRSRLNHRGINLVISLIITVFLSILIADNLPRLDIVVIGVVFVYLCITQFNTYVMHHSDRFPAYFIHKNVEQIRRKLRRKLYRKLRKDFKNLPITPRKYTDHDLNTHMYRTK